MKKEKTTIHDIARKLNITASTVSRALKDHPRISMETKKAVLKVAQKLNYQPNHIAAALRVGRSNIIGIIVPTADRSFFSSVVRGIEEIANQSRYHVMICQTYDNYEKEVATVEALLNARVDGIIASHGKETLNFDHFRKVKERGIPLILFDRSNDELEVSHVVIDDYLGGYKATEHLIQQGCRRIAHFTNARKISIYKERLRGYREALLNYGLPFSEELVVESNLQLDDGRNSMEQLLKLKVIPDAVFSASAYGAMGALQVLKEKKISVPEQVALVAFSNEPFTSFTDPALSTVDQHSMRMGNAAAQIFLEEVTSENEKFIPQKIVLKPELIVRASSLRKPNES
ncbi:LacI family transcriptional regulator [Fulvivirgaceae bacterium PWU4]|uniref:LacI family transcriptional regulator n=1 Tax=Chryseosolibacter histidini TaxID=2782349 RepID=A0AAP2GLD4_9BACT|nr:LacI family DNA-binding transcriptional regulator [Chryseosolibacter histidini]MBT1695708.1 LacI family transcriptional regulator [Chryseosolibacter histidini]